jgi:STE24 endopeptidase
MPHHPSYHAVCGAEAKMPHTSGSNVHADNMQIVAVLAHELGHWKMGHTIRLMGATQATILVRFLMLSVFHGSENLLKAFGFEEHKPVIISMMLFMLVSQSFDAVITWLFNILSRTFEFQADNFAVRLKHGKPLMDALRVLEKENKSDFVVDTLYSSYHYSHPPMQVCCTTYHDCFTSTRCLLSC